MMTQDDYAKLASAFQAVFADVSSDPQRVGVTRTVEVVADVLEADNPRFNRLKFYDAAGMPPRSYAYRRAVKVARIRALNDLNG